MHFYLVGKSPNSPHNVVVRCYEGLKNQSCHIDKALCKQTSHQILSDQLRLKPSIVVIQWSTFQACAFRGHDESLESRIWGNFLEMIKLLATYDKVDNVVLENSPQNAIDVDLVK